MRAPTIALMAALLAACTAQELQQAESDADAAVAATTPTIELACWLVEAADAGFAAYAASAKVDEAVIVDEKKATAAATAICAQPPTDLAQAIAAVMASYKAVVAVTPDN